MFSTQSSSSCSPISVPRTFSFRSFLFMLPLAAADASDRDVEGETRILLSTRRGQNQWEGVRALSSSLSPETLLLPVPCIDFFQPLLQSPRNFLSSIFLLQSFRRKKAKGSGGELGPPYIEQSQGYLLVQTRQRFSEFCAIPKNRQTSLMVMGINSYLSWMALSISRNLGFWGWVTPCLRPATQMVLMVLFCVFPSCELESIFVSSPFVFVSCVLSRHRRKRMLRRSPSPSMRNRAPSTRIGAARDPDPVPPRPPSLRPPNRRRSPEGKRKENSTAARRSRDRLHCTAERRKGGDKKCTRQQRSDRGRERLDW